ncbi:A disintegrin and metalloproteinase with thrombospondin motifs adt-1-like [Phlebotomus argentipes]|uniref:A disintegrin and metalloproteinase with thrombospondin motifs adt-1-like n=1 Tax=Phlebotomus argentipes TaxID=94469 RepID=UPI00289377D7|nr:A disintegrin and metalloproteinase with thrombospondin motifs adt-1-like [Phlebotomus argentipes]
MGLKSTPMHFLSFRWANKGCQSSPAKVAAKLRVSSVFGCYASGYCALRDCRGFSSPGQSAPLHERQRIGVSFSGNVYRNCSNSLCVFLRYYFETDTVNSVPEYEIQPLIVAERSAFGDSGERNLRLNFTAFNQPFALDFSPNRYLISPQIRIIELGEVAETLEIPEEDRNCHFLSSSGGIIAAVSVCEEEEDALSGIILMDDDTLEIRPLNDRLQRLLSVQEALLDTSVRPGTPHIIRKASRLPAFSTFSQDFTLRSDLTFPEDQSSGRMGFRDLKSIVELGVFFDEPAYRIFAPFFQYDAKKLRNMILAYLNGVQALYHHPSLTEEVDIVVVYMEIMRRQPRDLPHHDGERSALLDSFCAYQKRLNSASDADPQHWDMAVYISGLDFFAWESGKRNGVTMGLATVGGVCIPEYNCVVAEFGATNSLGKPYPSTGFTSVFILAHEIGHNLGMHHDGTGNSCPKDGFVMSPSRGTDGETTWSACSADAVRSLRRFATCLRDKPDSVPEENDAWMFGGVPGRSWTARQQCQLLLLDQDALATESASMCRNLHCRTPHRSGFYFAGPALEGTECERGKSCQGGECVPARASLPIREGGWSAWQLEKCSSGCIEKSRGFQAGKRQCTNPPPLNTDRGCDGHSFAVDLCPDDRLCRRRRSAVDFATVKCREFSRKLPELDRKAPGMQAPHESNRLWMSCAIFCKRRDTGAYYTPRLELNDLGIDPYFPDGTWCHREGGEEYFCRQHHCLPESFHLKKTDPWLLGEDIPLPGNAWPTSEPIDENLLKYHSLDAQGRPLLTHLSAQDVPDSAPNWTDDNDYLDLNLIIP